LIARIHHVGYLVNDIKTFAANFSPAVLEREIFDPLQIAKLAAYKGGGSVTSPLTKLFTSDYITWGFLKHSVAGLHRVRCEGINFVAVDQSICDYRMLKLRCPSLAVLFGRDVVFAVTRQKAILEFLL